MLEGLSASQAEVIDKMADGKNIQLLSVPGGGKTRTIAQKVLAFPHLNFIIISYNTKLVTETRNYIKQVVTNRDWKKTFVLVKTYHGLLSCLKKSAIHNDSLFNDCVDTLNFNALRKHWRYANFHRVIVDEGQDLRFSYFKLLPIFFAQVCYSPSMLRCAFLGDEEQVVYDFFPVSKADSRFLTLADQIFAPFFASDPSRAPIEWYKARLPCSYRLTPQIANFMNALISDPNRTIVSAKQPKTAGWVEMHICDVYSSKCADVILDIVKKEAGKQGQGYGDIMILFQSLNNRSPARAIVDELVANGVPVNVARAGTLSSSNSGENKVRILPAPSSKGLESRTVLYIHLDPILEPRFVRRVDFVACTRASEHLYLIQHANSVSMQQLKNFVLHTNVKQKDLRIVIQSNQPPDVLPNKTIETFMKRQSRIKTKDDHKHPIDALELFSFMDATFITNLTLHIQSQELKSPIADDDDPEVKREEFDDDDAVDEESKYVKELTCSFDHGKTTFNVAHIATLAIQFALELATSRHFPVRVEVVRKQLQSETNKPKNTRMSHLLDTASDTLSSLLLNLSKTTTDEEVVQLVIESDNMVAFGLLALVFDAYNGYREFLFAVTNFDFIKSDKIAARFELLYTCLQITLKENPSTAVWFKSETAHFKLDTQTLQVKACAPLVAIDKSFAVFFTLNHSATTQEDRLYATLAAKILRVQNNIFLFNAFDASVELVQCTALNDQATAIERLRDPCVFVREALNYKIGNVLPADLSDKQFVETMQLVVVDAMLGSTNTQDPIIKHMHSLVHDDE
jgi:hypothetical protein